MGFKALFSSVSIIIEELGSSLNMVLCHEDEPGDVLHHDNLGHAVWRDSRVVDQPAVPSRLTSRINTEIKNNFNHSNS